MTCHAIETALLFLLPVLAPFACLPLFFWLEARAVRAERAAIRNARRFRALKRL